MSTFKKKMGGVALATLGLSTCNNNGAVDPAPPPLVCPEVAKGEPLSASATLSGTELKVQIDIFDLLSGAWVDRPSVTDLMGATLKDVALDAGKGRALVTLTLDAPNQKRGAFTVKGEVTDYSGKRCPVERRFTFTIEQSGVIVAQAGRALPLSAREPVTIALAGRQGGVVELRAEGAGPGARLSWTATAGQLDASGSDPGPGPGIVRWTLPDEPGLYQVEVLADRGDAGVTLDVLTLEVT
jgi:hypothetical protein